MGLEGVTDAGPLIHLAEIEALLALNIFTRLHVPEVVWREATDQRPAAAASLLGLTNLQLHSPSPAEIDAFVHAHALDNLHSGEQAGLYLCQRLEIPLLLTDDLAAREAAQALKITPVGSVGLIVCAFRSGLFPLETVEQCLFKLQDVSSLFVTRAIVELAVEQLRAYKK